MCVKGTMETAISHRKEERVVSNFSISVGRAWLAAGPSTVSLMLMF